MANETINPKTQKPWTVAELQARILELEAMANKPKQIFFGISGDKGTISAYGINGTFPVSLYREQWLRLLADDVQKPLVDFLNNPEVIKLTPSKTASDDDKKAAGIARLASTAKQANGMPLVRIQTAEQKAKFAKSAQ